MTTNDINIQNIKVLMFTIMLPDILIRLIRPDLPSTKCISIISLFFTRSFLVIAAELVFNQFVSCTADHLRT